ncbi:MAG: surface-adhesin E family protein [Polaromonas sp.]
MGDPLDAAVNTIEVDPRPIAVNAHQRTLKLRVNRSVAKENRDGVPYRSFESQVVFDCNNKTARYAQISFYLLPVWQGPSHKTLVFPAAEPRWVEFRTIQPNPLARIIRAACETGAVQMN